MKNEKVIRKYQSAIIEDLLAETTPVEEMQVNTKMVLAARLDDLISERGWGKGVFAEKVSKNPSEITKWLSGTQNFTIDTLAEIAVALGTSIPELFAPRKIQVVNIVRLTLTARTEFPAIQYVTPNSSYGYESANIGSQIGLRIPLTASLLSHGGKREKAI